MKKLCRAILAILIFCCLLTAFFDVSVANAEAVNNVHLVAPVWVEHGQGKLYVADNITDGKSVVHIFDISSPNAHYVTALEFDFHITKLRFYGTKLYVLASNSYVIYNTTNKNIEEIQNTIFDIAETNDGNVYVLRQGGVFKNNDTDPTILDEKNEILSLAVTEGMYLYVMRLSSFNRYNTQNATTAPSQTIFNEETFSHCISNGQLPLFFNSQSVVLNGSKILSAENFEFHFYDIVAEGGNLYLLTSDNKVLKFVDSGSGFVMDSSFEIGSDVVEIVPPALSQLNSFCLARSKGYPSNIVYKTTDTNRSISQLIDDMAENTYIILGYEGDSQHDYYYVFVNGKFGWVKKSSDKIETDQKIELIDTKLNQSANFSAKLMSAGAVYVYYLPYDVANDMETSHVFNQTSTSMTEVKLLQQFESVGQTWYFVSYTHGGSQRIGFVKRGDVGNIFSTGGVEKVKLFGRMKINASLADNVNVFLTAELAEDQATVDPETNQTVTLKTGTMVNVIEQRENASYLQIVYQDGTTYFGWVANQFLIGENQPTTNTVVGMILMGVGIFAAVVFLIVFKTKRKQISTNNLILVDDEQNDIA